MTFGGLLVDNEGWMTKDAGWYMRDVYKGDYRDGKRHGKGKCTYANGDIYEGEFMDGKKHGKGAHRYANGDVYLGGLLVGRLAPHHFSCFLYAQKLMAQNLVAVKFFWIFLKIPALTF